MAFLLGAVRREELGIGSFLFFGDGGDGVRAEECRCIAEFDDPGELRFGDHAGGVRCEGESAAVQECAGEVSEWV